ncbi:transcription factor 15-like [Contarinia nasturtii]|uniref:transcription factor 15-like n=1 Tax=Contarinia nasturtii TaxID=265458 RepID=UPI0012D3CC55|nr:transcription factor 15-like [Contarinia nasturtii]XP_031625475.1 transcription factor 15-like [Contarinia nasturtii]XP_031625476.1 transcription factor 15-like [Contarinia nasturtii]
MKPGPIKRNTNSEYAVQTPVIRHQANARERHRTHSVNSAFLTLRELIPTEPKTRKLSKIETLRLAKSYIEHLFATLITGQSTKPCLYAAQMNMNNSYNHIPRTRNICTFCVATKHQLENP